jgi:hypothetical protein
MTCGKDLQRLSSHTHDVMLVAQVWSDYVHHIVTNQDGTADFTNVY